MEMMRLRTTILTVLFLSIAMAMRAQRHEIFNDRISSLQVVSGNDWLSPPVTTLGGAPIHISFDDQTHEYHRYTYRIEHCEADWSVSEEIFTSDYIDGFTEGNLIEDIEESLNTNVLYTHYHLSIPNEHCRLKMSGNYRITVLDDNNDEEPMFSACFMVVDPRMSISLGVTFVLFAGIVAGHIGFTAPTDILTFVQDFGLILFVFMIGLQVGPGFFESFREGGVKLNLLAASTIVLNVLVMFACYYIFFDTSNPINLPMMVGTMYGTAAKGTRYLEMTEGYVVKMALDKDNQVCGYQFLSLGKMMDAIKGGMEPNEAYQKNLGTYGRFKAEDGAVKWIDPRKE